MRQNDAEYEAEDEQGIATPLPLPRSDPRENQRFIISGLAGQWARICDVSHPDTDLDITLPRGPDSVLAILGERLCEFVRTDPKPSGSNI